MITDAIGNATSLFYDDEGLLSELVDSAGQRLMCRYAQGRLREVALQNRRRRTDAGALRLR